MKKYVVILIQLKWHFLNVDDYEEYIISDMSFCKKQNTIITFQSSDLVRDITNVLKTKVLPNIIDLECFDKQMSQEGKEFRGYKDWKIFRSLRYHKIIDSEFDLKIATIKTLLELMASLYKHLEQKGSEERKRFEEIEIGINNIIYERQSKGIRIDFDIAKSKCKELEREIYRIKNLLQLEYGIFSPDSDQEQLKYLKSKNYKIIQSIKYSFRIRKNDDAVCKLFYELNRNQQDLDSCIFMLSHWGGHERTFPAFFGFGTITSRITMRQPSIQNLRKENRNVLIPEINMKFLYIDYSQFEAGLMASLSDDEELINLYNHDDIYTNLAKNVLGSNEKRSEAKIVFYRYIYGDDSLNQATKTYFSKFKKLDQLRKRVNSLVLSNRKIETMHGNFRQLKDDEHGWALSHIIQGTASVIFKKSLIRVNREVKVAEFLIPMHDGALYQIPIDDYERSKVLIEYIYMQEFEKMCPKINPRLNVFDKFA